MVTPRRLWPLSLGLALWPVYVFVVWALSALIDMGPLVTVVLALAFPLLAVMLAYGPPVLVVLVAIVGLCLYTAWVMMVLQEPGWGVGIAAYLVYVVVVHRVFRKWIA